VVGIAVVPLFLLVGVVSKVSAEELLSLSVDSMLPEPPMESFEESLIVASVFAAITSEFILILLMILFVFH
jgi:hypothetical protein